MRVKLLVNWETGKWHVLNMAGGVVGDFATITLRKPKFVIRPKELEIHLRGTRIAHAWVEGELVPEGEALPSTAGTPISYKPRTDYAEGRPVAFREMATGKEAGPYAFVTGGPDGKLWGHWLLDGLAETPKNNWKATHSRTARGTDNERWMTPTDLFDHLHAEFRFQLDAAADDVTHRLPRWLGPGSDHPDALAVEAWAPGEAIFLNPPYADVARWVAEAARQATTYGSTVVVLVFASTENAWFHEIVMSRAAEVRFIRGRLSFLDPATREKRGTAPKGSVAIVFRPGVHRCLARTLDLRAKEAPKGKGNAAR